MVVLCQIVIVFNRNLSRPHLYISVRSPLCSKVCNNFTIWIFFYLQKRASSSCSSFSFSEYRDTLTRHRCRWPIYSKRATSICKSNLVLWGCWSSAIFPRLLLLLSLRFTVWTLNCGSTPRIGFPGCLLRWCWIALGLDLSGRQGTVKSGYILVVSVSVQQTPECVECDIAWQTPQAPVSLEVFSVDLYSQIIPMKIFGLRQNSNEFGMFRFW